MNKIQIVPRIFSKRTYLLIAGALLALFASLSVLLALPATKALAYSDSTGMAQVLDAPKRVKNDCNSANLNKDNCGIIRYLLVFINVLSGLVGVVVVLMIMVGGIQYTMSANNPQAVQAAKDRIKNAVFALVTFIFMFSFLQWIVPGGIF